MQNDSSRTGSEVNGNSDLPANNHNPLMVQVPAIRVDRLNRALDGLHDRNDKSSGVVEVEECRVVALLEIVEAENRQLEALAGLFNVAAGGRRAPR